MTKEELRSKLTEIEGKLTSIEQPVDNRFYLNCDSENAYDVNKFVFEDVGARFVIATGIDSDHCFEVLYHFSYDRTGTVINVKAFINDREKPSVKSISPFLPGAEWIEREIHDILGIEFPGHPDMRRLILNENWPEGEYPMRKEVNK